MGSTGKTAYCKQFASSFCIRRDPQFRLPLGSLAKPLEVLAGWLTLRETQSLWSVGEVEDRGSECRLPSLPVVKGSVGEPSRGESGHPLLYYLLLGSSKAAWKYKVYHHHF